MTIKKLHRTERAYLHAVSDGDKRAARRALRRLSRALCLLAVMAGLAACGAPSGPRTSDGGQATSDGSALDVDAGTPTLDAGAPALDAGPPAADSGTSDSGATLDAGAPALDAGPPCPGAAIDGHCYVAGSWDGLTGGACPEHSALVWWTDSAGQDRAAAAVGALGLGRVSTDLAWTGSSWIWADHAGAPVLRWAVAPRSTDHAPWLEADGMHASYRSDLRWLLCEVSP